MKRETTLSLSGKSIKNSSSLNISKNNTKIMTTENIKLKQLKIQLLNLYILPLIENNFDVLIQNICFLDKMHDNIDYYEKQYGDENISLYKDILLVFQFFLGMHLEIQKLEKIIYNSDTKSTNIAFKLPLIRLKPEYEIYHLILGKPNLKQNQIYNMNIINDITKLLQMNELSFENIKNNISLKYNIQKI
jgi:hypothetical protein